MKTRLFSTSWNFYIHGILTNEFFLKNFISVLFGSDSWPNSYEFWFEKTQFLSFNSFCFHNLSETS